jgi:hypothetical protein
MKFITCLFTVMFLSVLSHAQSIESLVEKEWKTRRSVNTLYLLSGGISAELEFSPKGKWTHSAGLFHIGDDEGIVSASISGASFRWNYYGARSTSRNSWVFGLGLSAVRVEASILFLSADSFGIVPELNAGYKWNFDPVSLHLGLGYGVANPGLILNLGYNFK